MYNKSGLCLASTKYGPWIVSAERQGRSVLRWEFHASDDRVFALAELTHAASPLRWANMKTSSRTFPCIFFTRMIALELDIRSHAFHQLEFWLTSYFFPLKDYLSHVNTRWLHHAAAEGVCAHRPEWARCGPYGWHGNREGVERDCRRIVSCCLCVLHRNRPTWKDVKMPV